MHREAEAAPPPASLAHLPLALFAAPMGVGGLGLAWREAAHGLGAPVLPGEALLLAAGALWGAITALHLVRLLRHPGALAGDLRHPIRSAFAGAVTIGLMIIAGGLIPHARGATEALWLAAVAGHVAIAAWTVRGLLTTPRDAATMRRREDRRCIVAAGAGQAGGDAAVGRVGAIDRRALRRRAAHCVPLARDRSAARLIAFARGSGTRDLSDAPHRPRGSIMIPMRIGLNFGSAGRQESIRASRARRGTRLPHGTSRRASARRDTDDHAGPTADDLGPALGLHRRVGTPRVRPRGAMPACARRRGSW